MGEYQPKTGEFFIDDEHKRIILSMEKEKYTGWHTDSNGKIVDEFDQNQIECSYLEEDEDGWGCGSDWFFSTYDLKAMADGIRSVIYGKTGEFEYTCQDDFFRINLNYEHLSDSFSFTAAILETLCGEYHISITKSALTLKELEAYISPFFEWSKQYPIV